MCDMGGGGVEQSKEATLGVRVTGVFEVLLCTCEQCDDGGYLRSCKSSDV